MQHSRKGAQAKAHMKEILCSSPRPQLSSDPVALGPLSFRVDTGWAKWPAGLEGIHVMNSCWGSDGLLYAATDRSDAPIAVLDAAGNFVQIIGEGLFKKAHGISYTAKGTLLVADADKNAHVVRELTPQGELLHTFGTPGVPGDSGYRFDHYETMVREGRAPTQHPWCSDPKAMARLDSIEKRGTPFCRPCAMILSPDGMYYAADGYGNCAVHRFDAQGNYLDAWGSPGEAPGAFRIVHAVLIDRFDRVWVADRENCRVQLFTRTGELLAVTSGGMSRAGGIWADHDFLYVGELDGGLTLIDLARLEIVGQTAGAGQFYRIHGVSGDREGNLYLSTNKWSPEQNNLIKLVRV